MLETILIAVLAVLRTIWTVAVAQVTRRNWPIVIAGPFFLWYVIKVGPERILTGIGKAIGVTFKSFGELLVWLVKGLGRWAGHLLTLGWRAVRFSLATVLGILGLALGVVVLSLAFPTFGLAFGVPVLIAAIGSIGVVLIFWR